MIIRKLESRDITLTKQIVKEAFFREDKDVLFNEWEFVTNILEDENFIDELCLVAEDMNTIVGYIILTKASIGKEVGLTLGPLAVKPNCQGLGIGTALIKYGLKTANDHGYEWVALTGGEYYLQFGFSEVKDEKIILNENHPENCYVKLKRFTNKGDELKGKLEFARSFYNEFGDLL